MQQPVKVNMEERSYPQQQQINHTKKHQYMESKPAKNIQRLQTTRHF